MRGAPGLEIRIAPEITNSPQTTVNDLTAKLLRALGSAGEWAWLKQRYTALKNPQTRSQP
jgi:hypothetical protein